ncbi:ATP-binding protein [Pantoea conspicua]|uniref:ATP-binding protein n=1 Tax=Pantoea conspicua TaxID=472705 RepID=UPI001FC96A7B|nr:serine/threonine-protein kinase [Pantoea conspicua]
MSTNPQALNSAENDEFTLSDDIVFSPLAQEGNIEWIRCRHAVTGEIFVLATAASEASLFQVTQLLKNEYELRDRLAESWALKPLGHTLHQGRYALIYRAFTYRTLADVLCLPAGTIAEFLHYAALLCSSLSQAHQQGLVHGDIKPANFFLNDKGAVSLGGFGLSSVQSELPEQARLPAAAGTLAYMSPEHTSRSAHPVSSVSDLYSLGIVLYELLTGRLPYGSPEGGHAEWVHHHIASEALSPHIIRPDVPAILSALILRLLAKSPEYRYQTADGVLADLRRCAATLMPDGSMESFALGLQDTSSASFSSDVLSTDHPQAIDILSAFEAVSQSGKHCLVTISGAAGSGKSSLIASSLKLLRNKKTMLSVVKVDQHSPILPYAVFTEVFRTLVLHVLGLPTEELSRWKAHISRSLGAYTGLAVNLVPELGILLNQKATVLPHSNTLDAKDRFNLVACSLVKAFTAQGRPLVMLIDDGHWADPASLLLLQKLLGLSKEIPLLLVVAHRDITSLPCPLIAGNLNQLRASTPRILEITPEPLSEKCIAGWLAGRFHTRSSATAELARVIHEKTGGNPLAVHDFFRQAVRQGLITHHAPFRWTYDSEAIKNCHYTANVAASVLQHLASLPLATRRMLGKLASLGSTGEREVMSRIIDASAAEIEQALLPAVTARLITRNEIGYAFMHDSMHEAALNLLRHEDKDAFH